MQFDEYQQKAKSTAVYREAVEHVVRGGLEGYIAKGEIVKLYNVLYASLGLAGEAGEIANKVKKAIRDHSGALPISMKADLVAELGDVLWYVALLAEELDVTLEFVAERNLKKLSSRKSRGELQGEGDTR